MNGTVPGMMLLTSQAPIELAMISSIISPAYLKPPYINTLTMTILKYPELKPSQAEA